MREQLKKGETTVQETIQATTRLICPYCHFRRRRPACWIYGLAWFTKPVTYNRMQNSVVIKAVGLDQLDLIRQLNLTIFEEERIINSFDREDLLMLISCFDTEPIGFKIGYRQSKDTFYSAKGGVLAAHRRKGIARMMLYDMIDRVRAKGYGRFAFDTFPNKHPGMTILGLEEGFTVVKADFNTAFQDYRLQFVKEIG